MVAINDGCGRDRLQCIIPPHMLENIAESGHPELGRWARDALLRSFEIRAVREAVRMAPRMLARRAPTTGKHRLVYDAGGSFDLPGRLVRSEGNRKPVTWPFARRIDTPAPSGSSSGRSAIETRWTARV